MPTIPVGFRHAFIQTLDKVSVCRGKKQSCGLCAWNFIGLSGPGYTHNGMMSTGKSL